MTSDESNLKARYEASWRIFREFEAAHGKWSVQKWVVHLTAQPGKVDGGTINKTAAEMLQENLNKALGS